MSCQPQATPLLSEPALLGLLAAAVVHSGAAGIRAEGIPNLTAIRPAVQAPIIGLWKTRSDGPFITPTLEHALAVAATGVEIVAIDGTARPRPDDRSLKNVVAELHARTGVLVLADVSTLEEGLQAEDAGADLVATTLSGYTSYTRPREGPDLRLIRDLSERLAVPIVAEGRIRTPRDAREARDLGAWAVVVGSAITDPGEITGWYVDELRRPAVLPK